MTNLSKTVNNCKTQPLISLNPYCWLIIMSFVLICWSITSLTIVSNSLHNIGVTLIGLYFLGNDLSPLFCMGVTFDFFNISGRYPSDNDLLNRINTGIVKVSAVSLIKRG